MSRRSQFLAAVLVVGLMVGAALPALAAEEGGQKTTIEVWDWLPYTTDPLWKAFIDNLKATFEARNPDIEVVYQTYGFGEYVDKILTAVASGTGPDVVAMSVLFAWDLWDQGVLAEINEYVARDPEYAHDKFIPVTQVYNQKDGHIFGTPWYIDTGSLLYNVEHYRAQGLDTSPWAIRDWDEFADYAKKLSRYDGGELTRMGYSLSGVPEAGFLGHQVFTLWLASNGQSFYSAEIDAPGFNNQAGIETVQFLASLVHEHSVAGFGSVPFITGEASMTDWHTGTAFYLRNNAPSIEWAMTNFPPGPSGSERATMSWGNMLGMLATSKNKDAAWKYMAHASSLETNVNMLTFMERPTAPRLAFYQTEEWFDAVQRSEWLAVVPDIVYSGREYVYPFWGGATLQGPVAQQLYRAVVTAEIAPNQAVAEMARLLAPAIRR